MRIIGSLIVAAALAVSLYAQSPPAAPADRAEVLARARAYSFQFRDGRYEVASEAVALLESAVKTHPDDGAVWNALAGAHALAAAAASQPGTDPAAAMAALGRAMQASDRAIALSPDDADVLANHGSLLIVNALLQRKFELIASGIKEMDRAVTLAPAKVAPRLARAFFGVNLPPPMRKPDAIADDLTFLASVAEGSKAGDMVHLMLGDLYAEIGRKDEARLQYQAAGRRPASQIREQAAARTASLAAGTVPAADVSRVRGALATNCTMCHGK